MFFCLFVIAVAYILANNLSLFLSPTGIGHLCGCSETPQAQTQLYMETPSWAGECFCGGHVVWMSRWRCECVCRTNHAHL